MKLPKIKMTKVKKGIVKVGKAIKRNAPTILTWVGTGSAIASPILSGVATIKSKKALDAQPDDSSFFVDMKVVVPKYIPTVIATAATIACGHSANHINLGRIGMASAAAAGAIGYLNDLQTKVKTEYGEEALQRMQAEIAAEKANQKLLDVPFEEIEDPLLLYEPITDQYITTSEGQFIRAREFVNRKIHNTWWDNPAKLSDFIDILGGESTVIANHLIWSTDIESICVQMNEKGEDWIGIEYSTFKSTDGSRYISYDIYPMLDQELVERRTNG